MIIFAIAAVLAACWLLLRLATLALPVYGGVTAGLVALHTGAGPFVSILVGLAAGALTLVAGQVLVATCRSSALRVSVSLVFAAPAAAAGYGAVTDLTRLAGSSEAWQVITGIAGAAAIGGIALTCLNALRPHDRSRIPPWESDPLHFERSLTEEG